MLDTISTFLNSLVWSEWILILIAILVIWLAIFNEDDDVLLDEWKKQDPTTNMSDIITCSIPWQKTLVFLPSQYKDYDIDWCNGFIQIELINGDTCYIPSTYTTVIDESFNSVSEKTAI